MAQTSYGSITITETTDIKTFVRYSENSDGRNYVATPTSTTKYIGIYVGPDGTEANPPAYNNSGWKWSKYQGNGIGSVETKFINWATNTEGNKPTTSAAWQTAPPAYDASKPYYYVWTRIIYSDASPTDNIYLDAGVSEAVVKSAQALSIATNVVEDAQGAIAIARAQEQHFWFNATDIGSGVNLIESGAYITDTAIDTFKSGKSGGYLLARSDKVEMGKASAKYAVLDATSLKFYTPGTTYKSIEVGTGGITIYRGWDATEQENLKGIEITPFGIDIYGSDQDDPDVMVTSDGIYMFKGGILSGTPGSTSDHFIYLSTEDLGSIYSSLDASKTDWREIIGTNFGVDSSGSVYATDANLSGTVNANEGSIGGVEGWRIVTQKIYNGTPGTYGSIYLSTANPGHSITINNQSRTDWAFTVGNNFGVTRDGYMFAKNAEIDGKIIATNGTIGATAATKKIEIGTDTTNASIYYGMDSLSSTSNGFYIGTDGISVGGGKFKVTASGQITATGLSISTSNVSGLDSQLTVLNNEVSAALKNNLIKDGEFTSSTITSNWSKESSATLGYSNGLLTITCSSSYYGIYQRVDLEPNTTYVLSAEVGSAFHIGIGTSTYSTDTGGWTNSSTSNRVYKTYTTGSGSSSYYVYIYAEPSSSVSTCSVNKISLSPGYAYPTESSGGDSGYITDITNNGIKITSKGNSSNYLTLDSSNGMQIYQYGRGKVAQFGSSVILSGSNGALEITSAGINITASGTGIGKFKFNNYPLLTTYKIKYVLGADIAPGTSWIIRQDLPPAVTDNYTVLGIIGYNFDKGANTDTTSSGGGISLLNVWECDIVSNGTRINFSARNTSHNKTNNFTIRKKIYVYINLLVTPKLAYSTPTNVDGGENDSTSTDG